MFHDYKVIYTQVEDIAKIAFTWRDHHDRAHNNSFDITEFVQTTLTMALKKKGPLRIEFFDRAFKYDDPAYVTFRPLTLHVDRRIWNDAKAGDGYARFVIAHEIGHIVLHDDSAKAFSSDPSLQIQFAEKEYSAEWQANIFAGYFLLPDQVIERFNDEELLHIFCNVAIWRDKDWRLSGRLEGFRTASTKRVMLVAICARDGPWCTSLAMSFCSIPRNYHEKKCQSRTSS
jgi:hypothetical protein